MHDDKTVQRFIDLRVQGWSFARLAAELGVSKPTLIAWSRKHQHTIANLVAIEREERLNQLLATSEERLRQLGEQLRAAEAELAKRDLTTLSTGRLLTHLESLRRQVRREAGPLQFVSTVDAIPEEEYADRIQIWKP
jgi:transcriptional regulator with XRE-family HTH domain